MLKVITGPMASGKSSALLQIVDRAVRRKQSVLVGKPLVDTRDTGIHTRGGARLDALPFVDLGELCYHLNHKRYDVVVIDEFQFFDEWDPLLEVLSHCQMDIYVAGLDRDFQVNPFEVMSIAMAHADEVEKLYSVCDVCGSEHGRFTQRIKDWAGNAIPIVEGERILPGFGYQTRCGGCVVRPAFSTKAQTEDNFILPSLNE